MTSASNRVGTRAVKVASASEIPFDEPTAFTVEEEEILIVNRADGIYAIDNICTHAEAYLDMGDYHAESCEIECPLHDGRFCLRTGAATAAPCVIPVKSYTVYLAGDDVMVELPGRLL
ncbi:Rieske 2Fe-2S domain-containing protein [Nocardia sp. R6R-6]|uniref:Rieske 2Fe-2S domain-containing protein n=1 Tax=Nocardia sp. R6R-6 TaxID=3459303 RepID=UPI00403DF81B